MCKKASLVLRRHGVVAEEVERARTRGKPQILMPAVNGVFVEVETTPCVIDESPTLPFKRDYLAELVMLQNNPALSCSGHSEASPS